MLPRGWLEILMFLVKSQLHPTNFHGPVGTKRGPEEWRFLSPDQLRLEGPDGGLISSIRGLESRASFNFPGHSSAGCSEQAGVCSGSTCRTSQGRWGLPVPFCGPLSWWARPWTRWDECPVQATRWSPRVPPSYRSPSITPWRLWFHVSCFSWSKAISSEGWALQMRSVLPLCLFLCQVCDIKKNKHLGQTVESSLFYASELDRNGDCRSGQPPFTLPHICDVFSTPVILCRNPLIPGSWGCLQGFMPDPLHIPRRPSTQLSCHSAAGQRSV